MLSKQTQTKFNNCLRPTLLFSCFLLVFNSSLFAQLDSVGLQLDRLGRGDISIDSELVDQQRVVSASRTLKSVEELPFTIYVVTKEEIFKNGYTTLVDVLKSVPGIKVSQPGSALEGETFLMRGLLGNSYTKILVNDLEDKVDSRIIEFHFISILMALVLETYIL